MRIQRLHLTNFRNFEEVSVDFGPKRNLILGANAQGKTNLLEAIHILGVGRSHRDRKDGNLVRFDQDFYRLEGTFDHIGVRTTVEVSYGQERKRLRLNGKDVRPADLIGLIGIVISSPDDIDLVKGSPGFRRTFLDMAISQASREYLVNLQHYVRALAQRNRLLRAFHERGTRAPDGEAWERKLVETGARIVKSRAAYLEAIRPQVEKNFGFLSGTRMVVDLPYEPRGYQLKADTDIETSLTQALENHRQLELARGYSLFGPHVDDLRFLADGRDIRQFGSEGEQRTAVLALRCAEVSGMMASTGRYPIVLLDDVFAELDEGRSKALTALISEFDQILLTSSRPASMPYGEIERIMVKDGGVSQGGTA